MQASSSPARTSEPKESAACSQDGHSDARCSDMARFCNRLERINKELAALQMPDKEHDLAVSERVVELVDQRRALFRATVCLRRLLPTELPHLLQLLIDQLRDADMISCRDRGEVEDAFTGLRRVASGLRQLCPIGRTRRRIRATAEAAIKRQTWHGDDTIMAVSSEWDGSRDLVYAGVSESWCDYLGYEPSEAIGRPLRTFMTPNGLDCYDGQFLASLRRDGCVHGQVIELRAKSGQARRVKVNVMAEVDERGRLVRSFGANRPAFQI